MDHHRLTADNTATLLERATLIVDAFDNAESRKLLSDYARAAGKPLVHAAISADGSFGLVRWDERFTPDAEDTPGEATCEGGAHLPMIGLLSAALARAIQDFQAKSERRDAMVSLSGVAVSTPE